MERKKRTPIIIKKYKNNKTSADKIFYKIAKILYESSEDLNIEKRRE